MNNSTIENLHSVLSEILEKKISNIQTRPLLPLGENYGSDILAVTLNVENNGQVEQMEMIAKLPPPGKLMKELFNFPVTFRNEVKFYTSIVPELIRFSRQKIGENFDLFPSCYGARIGLDSSEDLADDSAILLLENLKETGYECVDRFVSFDLATSHLVLETLATFHATTLALRQLESENFQKFDDLFQQYKTFDFADEKHKEHLRELVRKVEKSGNFHEYLPRVEKTLNSCFDPAIKTPKNDPKYLKEPWVCIIHTDAWVNNFMIKFDEGKPEKCKIIDWQLFEMGSPARDVIFLIFTSIQPEIVKEHFYKLIEIYHGKFVEILSRFGVDTGRLNLDEFHKEIKRVVKLFEFFRIIMMMEPIFKAKEDAKALDDYKVDDFGGKQFSREQKHRTAFVVEEFVRYKFI